MAPPSQSVKLYVYRVRKPKMDSVVPNVNMGAVCRFKLEFEIIIVYRIKVTVMTWWILDGSTLLLLTGWTLIFFESPVDLLDCPDCLSPVAIQQANSGEKNRSNTEINKIQRDLVKENSVTYFFDSTTLITTTGRDKVILSSVLIKTYLGNLMNQVAAICIFSERIN